MHLKLAAPIAAWAVLALAAAAAAESAAASARWPLAGGWLLQSSALVADDGARISTAGYAPKQWFKTSVPGTVLPVLLTL